MDIYSEQEMVEALQSLSLGKSTCDYQSPTNTCYKRDTGRIYKG